MATRKLKPTTPGQRFKVVTSFDVTSSKPEKSLLAVNTEVEVEIKTVR